MNQNTFGGRDPPGPTGGACALSQTSSRNGGLLLTGGGKGLLVRGGREVEERGDGKGGGRFPNSR